MLGKATSLVAIESELATKCVDHLASYLRTQCVERGDALREARREFQSWLALADNLAVSFGPHFDLIDMHIIVLQQRAAEFRAINYARKTRIADKRVLLSQEAAQCQDILRSIATLQARAAARVEKEAAILVQLLFRRVIAHRSVKTRREERQADANAAAFAADVAKEALRLHARSWKSVSCKQIPFMPSTSESKVTSSLSETSKENDMGAILRVQALWRGFLNKKTYFDFRRYQIETESKRATNHIFSVVGTHVSKIAKVLRIRSKLLPLSSRRSEKRPRCSRRNRFNDLLARHKSECNYRVSFAENTIERLDAIVRCLNIMTGRAWTTQIMRRLIANWHRYWLEHRPVSRDQIDFVSMFEQNKAVEHVQSTTNPSSDSLELALEPVLNERSGTTPEMPLARDVAEETARDASSTRLLKNDAFVQDAQDSSVACEDVAIESSPAVERCSSTNGTREDRKFMPKQGWPLLKEVDDPVQNMSGATRDPMKLPSVDEMIAAIPEDESKPRWVVDDSSGKDVDPDPTSDTLGNGAGAVVKKSTKTAAGTMIIDERTQSCPLQLAIGKILFWRGKIDMRWKIRYREQKIDQMAESVPVRSVEWLRKHFSELAQTMIKNQRTSWYLAQQATSSAVPALGFFPSRTEPMAREFRRALAFGWRCATAQANSLQAFPAQFEGIPFKFMRSGACCVDASYMIHNTVLTRHGGGSFEYGDVALELYATVRANNEQDPLFHILHDALGSVLPSPVLPFFALVTHLIFHDPNPHVFVGVEQRKENTLYTSLRRPTCSTLRKSQHSVAHRLGITFPSKTKCLRKSFQAFLDQDDSRVVIVALQAMSSSVVDHAERRRFISFAHALRVLSILFHVDQDDVLETAAAKLEEEGGSSCDDGDARELSSCIDQLLQTPFFSLQHEDGDPCFELDTFRRVVVSFHLRQLRRLRCAHAATVIFEAADQDGDGRLCWSEFLLAFYVLDAAVEEKEVFVIFEQALYDTQTASVDYETFERLTRDTIISKVSATTAASRRDVERFLERESAESLEEMWWEVSNEPSR